MFQPRSRFSDVAESRPPIASPISATSSAVLLDTGIFCPHFHSRDHWPYCRRRWVFAALTTLARIQCAGGIACPHLFDFPYPRGKNQIAAHLADPRTPDFAGRITSKFHGTLTRPVRGAIHFRPP